MKTVYDRADEWGPADYLPETPAWHAEAACLGVAPDVFFPTDPGGHCAEAKAICAGCPVKDVCLSEHLHEKHGVWGGTTEKERRRILRERAARRKRAAAAFESLREAVG